jgi:CheY-like chemotaxis protein
VDDRARTKNRLRALVVDDEVALRGMLVRVLEELGLDVIEAGDGREALGLVEGASPPDLLVVDLSMPHMRGDELLREVAARRPAVRAVLMSGHGEREIRARLGDLAERASLLPKPFGIDELVSAIDVALRDR